MIWQYYYILDNLWNSDCSFHGQASDHAWSFRSSTFNPSRKKIFEIPTQIWILTSDTKIPISDSKFGQVFQTSLWVRNLCWIRPRTSPWKFAKRLLGSQIDWVRKNIGCEEDDVVPTLVELAQEVRDVLAEEYTVQQAPLPVKVATVSRLYLSCIARNRSESSGIAWNRGCN